MVIFSFGMKTRICFRVLVVMRAALCVTGSSSRSDPRDQCRLSWKILVNIYLSCYIFAMIAEYEAVSPLQTGTTVDPHWAPIARTILETPHQTCGVWTRRFPVISTERNGAHLGPSRSWGRRRRARGAPPLAVGTSVPKLWLGGSGFHGGTSWTERGQLLGPQSTGSRGMMMLAQPRKKLPERSVDVCCMKCKTKLYKYKKGGKGSLVKCYRERIVEDHTGGKFECPGCGQEFARPTMIHGKPAFKMIGGKVFQK